MSKRAIVITTILVVLAALAFSKDPQKGQNVIGGLISWIWPS